MKIRPLPKLFVLFAGALVAHAQTAGTATSPAAGPAAAAGDQVVTLSEFDVSSAKVNGYVASESVTGTRIASKLSDLPFAVDVVTSDFINDFAAFNLNDQLAFVSSFSPSEVTGQFQLRGFQSPVVMVDGFRRIGLVDAVDIDRIEVIKGSAASIYGAVQPGGAVNILTKQPTLTNLESIDFGAGSDGFYRAALSASGPVGSSNTLFYRVAVADQSTKYAEEFSSQAQFSTSFKLLYKPSANTSLSFDFEHVERYEHPFNQVLTITEKQTMPWAGNSVTESQYYGMATTNLLNYNFGGPESTDHYRLTSGTISLQHRFNDLWSLKFGVNTYVNPYYDQLVGSGAYYPYGTGNITVVNGAITNAFTPEVKDQPQVDWKPQRGGGTQLDNLFAFDTGPVSHKLLLTADYQELSQRNLTLVPTVGTSQATDYYALYSPYNASGAPYYAMQSTWNAALGYGWNTTLYGQNPSLYNAVTTDQWTAAGDYGLFGSERATMFDKRLILMAGGRWDYVRNQVKNYNIPAVGTPSSLVTSEPAAYSAFDYNTSAWTYQLGASFKVTDTVNLYANKSSAFNPQPQINSYTGIPLPNNTSNGYEFGIKASFLEQRLNLSLDRFLINEYNLVQSETDPISGQKDTILSGQQQAKGYELDFNYQLTNDLIVLGDWGMVDAKVLQSDVITFLNDLPARRVPRNNVGMALHYTFSHGRLKGVYLTADTKYYSKSLVNLGSGKSLIPGPASTTVGSTTSIYYVPATNLTYTGSDPKITGEQKITVTPVINAPFPGNGVLPYPSQAANALINYPMGSNGQPLPLANPATPGIYSGEPGGVFVDDGRENNFNAPYAVFDVGAGFKWKTRSGYDSCVQLSVKNLLNRQYTWASGVPGNPLQVVATCSLKF